MSLVIPYAHVFKESIDCILWSLLALNAILLTSSVNTLYLSFLNFCYDFDINLLFFFLILYDFFSNYNSGQNIWNKIDKSSKTRQVKKNLISTFACFLTVIAKV